MFILLTCEGFDACKSLCRRAVRNVGPGDDAEIPCDSGWEITGIILGFNFTEPIALASMSKS